jgi:hypothetical protein
MFEKPAARSPRIRDAPATARDRSDCRDAAGGRHQAGRATLTGIDRAATR